MTRKQIEIEQKLERHAPGHFTVDVTTKDGQAVSSKTFTYYKTNKTYPIFKSLIATLRNFEDVDVVLRTGHSYLAEEINAIHEAEGTLAAMLTELLTQNNITINAV